MVDARRLEPSSLAMKLVAVSFLTLALALPLPLPLSSAFLSWWTWRSMPSGSKDLGSCLLADAHPDAK
jgi:hypothetical protein